MRDTNPPTVPLLPPSAPRVKPNAFMRWLARTLMKLGGWRVEGQWPDVPRVVLIVVPHSSNWDGLWGMLVKIGAGLRVSLLVKDTLLKTPVVGALLRQLGMIPVDRRAAHGVIEQAAAMIRNADQCWYVLAPEGTRKPVPHWKPGFWKIAHLADVPVLPAYFNYEKKIVGLGPVVTLSEDMTADIDRLRAWYLPRQGRHPGNP